MKLQGIYLLALLSGLIMFLGMYRDIDQALDRSAATEDRAYCDDKARVRTWTETLNTYPDDPAIIHLAAYQIGLCDLVRRGHVRLADAIDIFELERWRVIRRRENENIPGDIRL